MGSLAVAGMDDLVPGPPKEVIYENTFITEPEGYGEVSLFPPLNSTLNRHPLLPKT